MRSTHLKLTTQAIDGNDGSSRSDRFGSGRADRELGPFWTTRAAWDENLRGARRACGQKTVQTPAQNTRDTSVDESTAETFNLVP